MTARGPQFQGELFHGTSTPLKPGDKVLPSAVTKARAPNSPFQGHRMGTPHDPYEHASASASEKHAWEFAGMTAQRVGGRATVFRVTAPTDAKRGLEPKEVLSKEGFPVREAEHIRPPEEIRKPGTFMSYYPNPRGRQGTLPLDWTPPGRHSAGSMSSWVAQRGDQWNHPTERDRKHEAARIELQEQLKQPDVPKGKPGPKQPMLPGMRGTVKRQPKRKP